MNTSQRLGGDKTKLEEYFRDIKLVTLELPNDLLEEIYNGDAEFLHWPPPGL